MIGRIWTSSLQRGRGRERDKGILDRDEEASNHWSEKAPTRLEDKRAVLFGGHICWMRGRGG